MAPPTKDQFAPFTTDGLPGFEPAYASATALLRASLDASRVWTEAYLDGVNTSVAFQRELLETYGSANEQYLSTAGELAERAERVGSEVVAKGVEAVKEHVELMAAPTEEPFAGYDRLTADEVVAKLPGVSQRTLVKVGVYERAHQDRGTILTRVESLTGEQPAPGYDELTVSEIQQLLDGGDADLAKRVRTYERAHGARSGVIAAAERQLKQS